MREQAKTLVFGIEKTSYGLSKSLFLKKNLLHSYPSRLSFFVFTKISYFQPFREIKGEQKNPTIFG